MERSNLFNHLLRIFDEGLSMKCKKGSTTKVQGKRLTEIAARCKNYKA